MNYWIAKRVEPGRKLPRRLYALGACSNPEDAVDLARIAINQKKMSQTDGFNLITPPSTLPYIWIESEAIPEMWTWEVLTDDRYVVMDERYTRYEL